MELAYLNDLAGKKRKRFAVPFLVSQSIIMLLLRTCQRQLGLQVLARLMLHFSNASAPLISRPLCIDGSLYDIDQRQLFANLKESCIVDNDRQGQI